jgi:hypothetical protein
MPMGRVNHSVSIVAKVLPADVRGQIELDLTEGCKSQAELLAEYSTKFPAEFGQFSERAFYRWCQGILDAWDTQRRELARERLRATYALKNSAVAQASLQDCEEAAQRKFHELLAAIATDQATDVDTLKSVVAVVDSIGTLGKLSINRDKLAVLQAENDRRAELHEVKMAELKTAVSDEAKKGDGKVDAAVVADLIDHVMRGEAI